MVCCFRFFFYICTIYICMSNVLINTFFAGWTKVVAGGVYITKF